MMISARTFASGAVVAALLVSGGAFAQEEVSFGPQTYAVEGFEMDGFVGTVDIIVEDRAGVEIAATGPSDPMSHLVVERAGDTVEVRYDNPAAQRRAWSNWTSGWAFWRRDDNEDRLAEFPVVTVRVPRGAPVNLDGMIGRLDAGDLGGTFALTAEGSLQAEIGDVATAAIASHGSGHIVLGDVAGELSVLAAGSGRLEAGTSQTASVEIRGSASVTLGAIDQGLSASIAGSGNINVARADGPMAVSIQGSGDVRIDGGHATALEGTLTGSGRLRFGGTADELTLAMRGSGDTFVEAVQGPVEIRITGSGDAQIAQGRAEGFTVRSTGSGDVHFGGTAVDADISTSGSGEVVVEGYEGRYQNDSNG